MAQPESRAVDPRQPTSVPHPLSSDASGGLSGPGATSSAGPVAGGSWLRGCGGGSTGVPCQAQRPATPTNRTHYAEGRSGTTAADWRGGTDVNLLIVKLSLTVMLQLEVSQKKMHSSFLLKS